MSSRRASRGGRKSGGWLWSGARTRSSPARTRCPPRGRRSASSSCSRSSPRKATRSFPLQHDLGLDAAEVARLYRQRGDCENIFDEMKNDWGWGGFSAHDLGCTAILAGLVALVANWWNLFCRIGEDGSHREAKTSRPLLQRCVASIGEHARERVVTLFTEGKEKTRTVFSDIAKFLNRVATATQLEPETRWMVVVRYACRQFGFSKHEFPPWIDDQYMLNL